MKTISYAIIRNENHKMGAVTLLERHNERRNKNYSNKDIDLSRSSENYHLKQIQTETYGQEFERIRIQHDLKGNLRLTGQKQSTIMCEFMITSDNEFFDKLGKNGTKHFFEKAYDFVTMKVGEDFIVSAVVHMDEKTPHMHVTYIPVINGKDRKGKPCKRINCSEFWKGRDSYSRLQDEYFDYMTGTCGYQLERGEKGSDTEHLSVAEYKLKKATEQLNEVTAQLSEIESIENVSVKPLPLNTVALKKSDYETLTAAAKSYVIVKSAETENITLKEQCSSLQTENEALKSENDKISTQLHEIDIRFADYYADTVDERKLVSENEKLTDENRRLGNQVHTLTAEGSSLREENVKLNADYENERQELTATKVELSKTQALLNALQQKFDKVMEFLRVKQLKEEWERFIKPITHHKSL